jgi:hypothetical protein
LEAPTPATEHVQLLGIEPGRRHHPTVQHRRGRGITPFGLVAPTFGSLHEEEDALELAVGGEPPEVAPRAREAGPPLVAGARSRGGGLGQNLA